MYARFETIVKYSAGPFIRNTYFERGSFLILILPPERNLV